MISGIILAAGASSRMGQVKAALPFGPPGHTVLSRIVSAVLCGGVLEVVVVAGAHIAAVRNAMPPDEPRARVVDHPRWRLGQVTSLVAGLDAVDQPLLEAVVVTPVDLPLLSPLTVATVVEAWRRTRAPIVRPVDGERHGHPVVFDRRVFNDLRSADASIGAKAVFAAYRDEILNLEVKDNGAFEDIDTPADYQRLLKLAAS